MFVIGRVGIWVNYNNNRGRSKRKKCIYINKEKNSWHGRAEPLSFVSIR